MQNHSKFIALIFVPAGFTSLFFVIISAYRAFVINKCDPVLGCTDGFTFDLAVAGVAFLLSLTGSILGTLMCSRIIRNFQTRQIVALVTVLTVALTLLRYSVHYWPYRTPTFTLPAWVLCAMLIYTLVIMGFRLLASNYAIKGTSA
jgi:hypothetical protein